LSLLWGKQSQSALIYYLTLDIKCQLPICQYVQY
jgi:hypothetical protein